MAARLRAAGVESEVVTITTSGDRREIPRDPADVGKALWTREIEEALASGDIDLAVHSLKDLPAALPEGLMIGAVLPREDPGDVLISRHVPRSIEALGRGAAVGTGSIRRRAYLHKARSDLKIGHLKGNVPTRLKRLDEGRFDAIVLAAAGLNRLDLRPPGLHPLDYDVMAPALCQGIVAVEIRREDRREGWVAALNDVPTMTVTRAERALLDELDVGCGAPVGGLARVDGGTLRVFGEVLSPDGSRAVREEAEGAVSDAETLGRRVGQKLIRGDAADLLENLRH